jgi:hypothetical protein
LYDYHAQTDEELSIKEGDSFLVYNQNDPEWWWGLVNDEVGLVPANYIEVVSF